MGMGIRVKIPFKVGTTVHIRTNEGIRSATVRHCSGSGSDYFIGVEFLRWAGPS